MSDWAKIQSDYEDFHQQFASIIIATVSDQGIPNASYAPFVMDELKNIYIYVSGLSIHTINIESRPDVSVLFIEDEGKSPNIFARRRLNFDCRASLLERESIKWQEVVDQFQARFGTIIEVMKGLADFRVFQLTPTGGRFVIGFGAAYHIHGDNLHQLVHINRDNISN